MIECSFFSGVVALSRVVKVECSEVVMVESSRVEPTKKPLSGVKL